MTPKTQPEGNVPAAETPDETRARLEGEARKGRATPTRKEREAANRRPLVPNDRKEANRAAKAQLAAQRERARVGLAAGDEQFLPARDRGPQKKWIRDYVDSRFSVGEYLIPAMFIIILMTVVPIAEIQLYAMLALWVFFIVSVIDAALLGRSVKKKLANAYGESRVERGVRWYAAMRAFQMRVLRLPKPQVKRGKTPPLPH